jgi:hypothetical protein
MQTTIEMPNPETYDRIINRKEAARAKRKTVIKPKRLKSITLIGGDSVDAHVYLTYDYDKFKTVSGNRTLKTLHLNRLLKSIQSDYLFTVVIVNENFEIIDGQHRFDCIVKEGLAVRYVVCKGYTLDEVHTLNQNSKVWGADDYMSGYCEMDYAAYKNYRAFKEKYGLGHRECMSLLSGQKGTFTNTMADFKDGAFRIVNMNRATVYASRIVDLQDIYAGAKRRSFTFTMFDLFDNPTFDYDRFLKQLNKQPSMLTNCTTKTQYLELVEYIYNYEFSAKNKISLRF